MTKSKTIAEPKEWLDVDEAAALLGVCRETIRRHVRRGLIAKDQVRRDSTIGYPLSIRSEAIVRLKREGVHVEAH